VFIAQGAIELIVLTCLAFRSTLCTCGLALGSYPENLFENTRDGGSGELTMISTRLPKNFQCNHRTLSAGDGMVNV
jgi:hypothetical protein